MSRPVFISYARSASAADARALADRLEHLAFFDTDVIEDGDMFPQRLLDGVLDAQVVVIFATKSYTDRRFCRLEMRLALAGCNEAAQQIVLALGKGSNAVLDAMPAAIADQSWPQADEPQRLNTLVRQRLQMAGTRIRDRLATGEAQKLSVVFLEESKVPDPCSLRGVICSLPPGVAGQSIGARFVGRADDLRRIHQTLLEGVGGAAQLTSRISAAGGFGKTRLAVEYLHRYGARYYPGGIFWVNANSKSLEAEFWRVLNALEPAVPDLATMHAQGRNITRELERALRSIGRPALYVVDDIPETGPGEAPAGISDFCPALGAVTILATSRQETRETTIRTIQVDVLSPEAAVVLLTENVPSAGALSWDEWTRIATWVGHLPLALDLLNRALALNAISPRDLLLRADGTAPFIGTEELDSLREALRGQVPNDAVRGVTEAFSISFEKLDEVTKRTARILAQLASTSIPEAYVQALADEYKSPRVRVALLSRHFVTAGDGLSFGVMHRLMADFLRSGSEKLEPELIAVACRALLQIMTADRCRNPRDWPLMNLCRPHAEVLATRGLNGDETSILSGTVGLGAAVLTAAQGDYARARHLEDRISRVWTHLLGPEHPKTLTSMNNLAATLHALGDLAGARKLLEETLEIQRRVLGPEHPDTLGSMNNLAGTLQAQGDLAGARKVEEETLDILRRVLGPEAPKTLILANNLAEIMQALGDLTGARKLEEETLDILRRVLGPEDPTTLTLTNNLAQILHAQGDLVGARKLLEETLEIQRRLLGPEHPNTLASMNNLAQTLQALGDLAGARKVQEETLEISRRVRGPEHPDTLASMGNLANTALRQGDLDGARKVHEETLDICGRVLGPENPKTLISMNNLAATLQALGDLSGARKLQEETLEIRRRTLGPEHPETLMAMNNLAGTLRAEGDFTGAVKLQEQALDILRRVLGQEHPFTSTTAWNLFYTLLDLRERAAALAVLQRDLLWLLDREASTLSADQRAIRDGVAKAQKIMNSRLLQLLGAILKFGTMKVWLSLVAICFWGLAFNSFFLKPTRIVFGIVGFAAFLWSSVRNQRLPANSCSKGLWIFHQNICSIVQ
jgi:tetratricopeptide (TPR) repeat protein